ncbi:MAG TPA: DnaB-like helicase C-terminal domain-containing protein [Bdellovibrionota bacterium]|nr:DnaB-like helicase C-terminal domain-containing protein [Bdellovibrionota bacterium]
MKTKLQTGIHDLDTRLCGGLRRGQVTVTASRPVIDKAAVALTIASNALRRGLQVAVISNSVEVDCLERRLLSHLSGVPLSRLLSYALTEKDLTRIKRARHKLSRLIVQSPPFIFVPESIRSFGRPDLVVIEELHGYRYFERRVPPSAILRWARSMAKKRSVPVIVCGAVGRKAEGRQDKRPRLSDLKDSKPVLQYADLVALIYRDEIYDRSTDEKGVVELDVAQNRDDTGKTGIVKLSYSDLLF